MDNIKKVKMLDGKEIYFKEENGDFIEVEKPLNSRFLPRCGDVYFFARDCEYVRGYYENDDIDVCRMNSNNIFKTKEEAERKSEITKILHEHSHNFSVKEWGNDGISKYYLYAETRNKELKIGYRTITSSNDFYFKTKQQAQLAMDLIGYDDYLKYVLGIYEE